MQTIAKHTLNYEVQYMKADGAGAWKILPLIQFLQYILTYLL